MLEEPGLFSTRDRVSTGARNHILYDLPLRGRQKPSAGLLLQRPSLVRVAPAYGLCHRPVIEKPSIVISSGRETMHEKVKTAISHLLPGLLGRPQPGRPSGYQDPICAQFCIVQNA